MYNDSVVTTTYGPVRGWIRDGIHTFKGIRYGRDTAPTRFLPPIEPEPWTEVQNAFEFGPTAPQDHPVTGTDRGTNPFLVKIGLSDNYPESEDMLFMNVWTPGIDDAKRPVMVWVHSGGYSVNSASSPSIDGASLARNGDVVTVSFNHRLNVLGYAHLTDDPSSPFAGSGNAGMLDIVAALTWVQNNIATFGGDPGNVTIFGQSGGAMKVSTLLGMPGARGLFHKAIMQSGASPRALPAATATENAAELYTQLGLPVGDIEALQKVPLKDLMVAYHACVAQGRTFEATVDGVVLPADPYGGTATELSADIPVIVGDMDTEMTLFVFGHKPHLYAITQQEVEEKIGAFVGEDRARELIDVVKAAHPDAGPYELICRLLSHGAFGLKTAQLAESKARQGGAPTYRYRVAWRTPVDDGAFMSPHELDVALVFGNVDAAIGLNGGGEEAHRLSEILQNTWLTFARTGSPINPLVPEWPVYDAETRPVLTFAPEPVIAHDVDGEELRTFERVAPERLRWFAAV